MTVFRFKVKQYDMDDASLNGRLVKVLAQDKQGNGDGTYIGYALPLTNEHGRSIGSLIYVPSIKPEMLQS